MSSPKSKISTVINFSILGSLLTVILTTLFLPKLVVWYFEPVVNPGCSCATSIDKALSLFRMIQLIGVGIGALFGLILAIKFVKPQKSDAQRLE